MGYFKDKKLEKVTISVENSLVSAMELLDPKGDLINAWSFDEKGDVILYQVFSCGCNKEISRISLDIPKNELGILQEEEFALQVEDILLEVNDKKGYDNLLFNVSDYKTLRNSCEKCK